MTRGNAPMDYFSYQLEKQKAGKVYPKTAACDVVSGGKSGIQVVEMDHASTTIVQRIAEGIRKRWAGE